MIECDSGASSGNIRSTLHNFLHKGPRKSINSMSALQGGGYLRFTRIRALYLHTQLPLHGALFFPVYQYEKNSSLSGEGFTDHQPFVGGRNDCKTMKKR